MNDHMVKIAKTVECPKCYAPEGERCMDVEYNVHVGIHHERFDLGLKTRNKS